MNELKTKQIETQIKEIRDELTKINEKISELKISLFGTEIVDGVIDILKKIKDVLDNMKTNVDVEIDNKINEHLKKCHEEKEQKKLDINMIKWILIIIALFLAIISPMGIKILDLVLGKLL